MYSQRVKTKSLYEMEKLNYSFYSGKVEIRCCYLIFCVLQKKIKWKKKKGMKDTTLFVQHSEKKFEKKDKSCLQYKIDFVQVEVAVLMSYLFFSFIIILF